jgi:DNA-binding transcriptional LysR family regulator
VDLLAAMKVFVKVVEANSYAHAAEVLDISVPRISRTISELEEHLGVRLLQRTTRRMSMTEAGRLYLDRCRLILGELEDTHSMLTSSATSASGRLRIVAPPLFAMRKLGPVLRAYQLQHPNVVVDLSLSDRAVDLIEEEFDLGIVAARHVRGQTQVSRPLMSTGFFTCASPEYLAANGTPTHPSELAQHPYLAFRTEHGSEDITFDGPDGTPITASIKPAFYTNNIGMVRRCALAGLGIALLSAYLVDDDIRSGRLIRVLPDYRLPEREFRLVYANRKYVPLKVKAFIDLVVEHFRGQDQVQDDPPAH